MLPGTVMVSYTMKNHFSVRREKLLFFSCNCQQKKSILDFAFFGKTKSTPSPTLYFLLSTPSLFSTIKWHP
jgi:hypothetical protein